MRKDTAGHEIAKSDEKEKQRNNAIKALEKAKQQEASKNGRYVWDQQRRGYFFNPFNTSDSLTKQNNIL